MIQEYINNEKSVLGFEVIGVDGCQEPYKGVIKEVSIYDHSVIGKLIQVWVEWDNDPGHLTPYSPHQFSKWGSRRGIGVYFA